MRAYVMPANCRSFEDIRMVERPDPVPGAGQVLLRTIWLSHSVDTIFLLTNGGPGYANYTIALYSFLLTWNQLQLGYPSALAIMLSVVLLAAASVYVRFIERTREWM